MRLADLFSPSLLAVSFLVGFLLAVIEFGVFMGLPLVALVWIYVFWVAPNYFFEIVEYKALGNEGWPVFSLETLVAGKSQVGIIFSVVVLAVAGGYSALQYAGRDTVAGFLLAASVVVFPASVALLAVTREFLAAIDPRRLVAAGVGMGAAYLYCLLASVVAIALFRLAQIHGGLWYFALIYGLFWQAYLIGSTVYARRNVLGVSAPRSPEARSQQTHQRIVAIRERVLNQAYGFAAHGNLTGALKHIENYIDAEDDSLEARLWFLNESMRWEQRNFALAFGGRLADYCERRGFVDEAAALRQKCERLRRT